MWWRPPSFSSIGVFLQVLHNSQDQDIPVFNRYIFHMYGHVVYIFRVDACLLLENLQPWIV